jgi:uncharacterized protein (DUF58 family)
MVTHRARLLTPLGLGALLGITGLLLRNAEIVTLAIPLLLYAGILLYDSASSPRINLSVERHLDVLRTEEGRSIHGTLILENRGPSIALLGCEEVLPFGVEVVDGETATLTFCPENTQLSLNYTIRAPRGIYVLPGGNVISWNRFAIIPKRTFLPLTTTCSFLPRVEKVEEIKIRPRRTRVYAGAVKANLGGNGLEFFGCREYTLGDDIRHLNWRAYARRGDVIVNEYEQERIADITLILDAREFVNTHIGNQQTFDYAARAAATIASHFLKMGNGVGLLIYGDYLNWTYHGYGRPQQERILEALAKAVPAEKFVFEDLRYIPTRLFPSRSQLVIISPLADEDDVEILGELHARGYRIILVSPNSLALEQPALGANPAVHLGVRVMALRRELLLSTLRHTGMDVVDWDITEPLALPIAWALSRKGRRFS